MSLTSLYSSYPHIPSYASPSLIHSILLSLSLTFNPYIHPPFNYPPIHHPSFHPYTLPLFILPSLYTSGYPPVFLVILPILYQSYPSSLFFPLFIPLFLFLSNPSSLYPPILSILPAFFHFPPPILPRAGTGFYLGGG